MRSKPVVSSLAIAFVLLGAGVAPGRAAASDTVPCGVFGAAASSRCPNPVVEGVVDNQWVAVVQNWDGTNGGATDVSVLTVGLGGNGVLAQSLGRIGAAGPSPNNISPDRIAVQFQNGKLWVINAIYLAGQAHCCATQKLVRQFGFHNKKLHVEATATVKSDATTSEMAQALRRGSFPLTLASPGDTALVDDYGTASVLGWAGDGRQRHPTP